MLADAADIAIAVLVAVAGFAVVILVCVVLLALFARVLPAPADPERHLTARAAKELPPAADESSVEPAEPRSS